METSRTEAMHEFISKYSEQELKNLIQSFDNIKHILGPFGLFMPILDEQFNDLRAREYDEKCPGKIGPERNQRLSFLLEEYEKALPLIEFGLKFGEASIPRKK